jgi:hypothetical protein
MNEAKAMKTRSLPKRIFDLDVICIIVYMVSIICRSQMRDFH